MGAVKTKLDIRKLDLDQLQEFFTRRGMPAFRGRQVYQWLWEKSAHEFTQMTNLSLETRELLSQEFEIRHLAVDRKQQSSDGTLKTAFQLYDHHQIEGVLIPTSNRMTACVSSQVGCSLSCKFCATGFMERQRNLEPGEIYDQVTYLRDQALHNYNIPLTNIVFMGMGEPLLNYKHVLQSIHHITSPTGLGMSSKRITVSTAGIAKMIEKLADDQVKFNLALSLHAANDQKRSEIMPINESNSLKVLSKALNYFHEKTRSAVTLEYIVFDDFNDNLQDAEELARFARTIPCKINLIEYNPISEANFNRAGKDKLDEFAGYLSKRRLNVNIRRSRGKDIDAACGQLANK